MYVCHPYFQSFITSKADIKYAKAKCSQTTLKMQNRVKIMSVWCQQISLSRFQIFVGNVTITLEKVGQRERNVTLVFSFYRCVTVPSSPPVSWTTMMLLQSTPAARASVTSGTTWAPWPRRGGTLWRWNTLNQDNSHRLQWQFSFR